MKYLILALIFTALNSFANDTGAFKKDKAGFLKVIDEQILALQKSRKCFEDAPSRDVMRECYVEIIERRKKLQEDHVKRMEAEKSKKDALKKRDKKLLKGAEQTNLKEDNARFIEEREKKKAAP